MATPEEKARRAKELRAKQLRAKAAAAAAAAPPEEVATPEPAAPVGPGRGEAFLRGAGQGATLGFGDELQGGWKANVADLQRALSGDVSGALRSQWGGLKDMLGMGAPPTLSGLVSGNDGASEWTRNFRAGRDKDRNANAAAEQAHGGMFLAGNLAGGLATAPFVPGAGGVRTLGQLVRHGAKAGGLTGGAFGLGTSNADLTTGQGAEWMRAAKDTGAGALLGAGVGAALPPLASALGWSARNLGAPAARLARGGFVEPTAEAQRLIAEGADLSLGQMNPSSAFGRIEELAAAPAVGSPITAIRERGTATTRDALLKRARAPGAKPPTGGAPVAQQLEEIRAGFGQIYDEALDGARLQPDKYLGSGQWRGLLTDESLKGAARKKGAFELAAGAKDIDASPAVRERALAWLTDKAQTLVPAKSGPNAGTVDARSIQALRTQLRDKIRSLGGEGDDRQLREIYGRAEEFVSELLEGQLPPEKAAMLKGADTAYRNLLATEDAAKRAFVQDQEFTPAQLLQSIRKRGATPDLESLTRDAQATVAGRYPLTGIQQAAISSVPGLKWTGPMAATLFNSSPGFKRHALNQVFAPGLPARLATATGRAAEGAAKSPRFNSAAIRTLVDLLDGVDVPDAGLATP